MKEKQYTNEFKTEAVRLAEQSKESTSQVARELGGCTEYTMPVGARVRYKTGRHSRHHPKRIGIFTKELP